MQEFENLTAEEILINLSKLMGVDVKFENDPSDASKVSPVIGVDAVLSKIMSLMVYIGWNVPVSCMPSYTRVHADVEAWKIRFNPPKEKVDGVS